MFFFCVQFISTIFSQFIDIVPGHNELWPRRQCDIQDGQNILLEDTSGKLYYAAEAQKSFDKKNHTFPPDFSFLFLLLLLFACFFFCCSICLCVFVRFCFHVFYFTDDSWRHVTKQVIYTTCTYVCVCVRALEAMKNCETRAWSQ